MQKSHQEEHFSGSIISKTITKVFEKLLSGCMKLGLNKEITNRF